jgi:hypothetical protein
MFVEACSAIALTVVWRDQPLVWVGLGLLTIVWLSTLLLQIPQHRKLARGFDSDAHRRLVTTNWYRTLAWSARSVIALVLVPDAV